MALAFPGDFAPSRHPQQSLFVEMHLKPRHRIELNFTNFCKFMQAIRDHVERGEAYIPLGSTRSKVARNIADNWLTWLCVSLPGAQSPANDKVRIPNFTNAQSQPNFRRLTRYIAQLAQSRAKTK